ncbi:hypothetical protein B0A94_18360, partial [Pseudomonas syringae]
VRGLVFNGLWGNRPERGNLVGTYKSQAQAVIAGYFFSSSDGFATLGSVSLITLGARLITQGGLV